MKQLIVGFILLMTLDVSAQYSSLPITLSLPMNEDTIQESEPNFVWQANLSSLQNDPRLSMRIVVVKMEGEQTATEAIVENNPVFIREDLLSNSVTYANSGYELENGKWYAWQLIYLFNGVQVQQSEVWKFILSEPLPPPLLTIKLRRANDNNIYALSGNELNLSTDEAVITNLNAVLLNDENEQTAVILAPFENNDQNEMKSFRMDLSDLDLDNGSYRFEWRANKNVVFTLYFEK